MLVVHLKEKGSIHMELKKKNARLLGGSFAQSSFITILVKDIDGR
jgi:hypothetical protein